MREWLARLGKVEYTLHEINGRVIARSWAPKKSLGPIEFTYPHAFSCADTSRCDACRPGACPLYVRRTKDGTTWPANHQTAWRAVWLYPGESLRAFITAGAS